jgi:hypothetical protein
MNKRDASTRITVTPSHHLKLLRYEMAEITIPYAELIDAVAAIDRMRSDHPERDNDPATKGIKLGSHLVMSGSGRFTHDPNAAFGGSITIREDHPATCRCETCRAWGA